MSCRASKRPSLTLDPKPATTIVARLSGALSGHASVLQRSRSLKNRRSCLTGQARLVVTRHQVSGRCDHRLQQVIFGRVCQQSSSAASSLASSHSETVPSSVSSQSGWSPHAAVCTLAPSPALNGTPCPRDPTPSSCLLRQGPRHPLQASGKTCTDGSSNSTEWPLQGDQSR